MSAGGREGGQIPTRQRKRAERRENGGMWQLIFLVGMCAIACLLIALGVSLTMDTLQNDAPDLYNEWMRRRAAGKER